MKTDISLSRPDRQGRLGNYSITCTAFSLWLLLLLAQPPGVQAQYRYTTNNGNIAITKYTGSGGAVVIPSTIDGLPVSAIGFAAFANCTKLDSVVIPTSVRIIEDRAFQDCSSPTNVIIGSGVTSIGNNAFHACQGLKEVTIPSSVTNIASTAFSLCSSLVAIAVDDLNPAYSSMDGVLFNKSRTTLIQCPGAKSASYTIPDHVAVIGGWSFRYCTNLSTVTVPSSVTSIEDLAFATCTQMKAVYFQGNAPTAAPYVFGGTHATVYYVPGTTGWQKTFAGLPTTLWRPAIAVDDRSFGVRTNEFGFNVNWADGGVLVMEACIDLRTPSWLPLRTNALTGSSAWYFSDPQWTSYPSRFYRVRSQ